MFLYIPLGLILISSICISILVVRKREYIKKLYILNSSGSDPASVSFDWASFTFDFIPELKTIWDKLGVNKHKSLWLVEAEKLLRRTRLVFLKIDRMSDTLIGKIRRIHLNDKIKEDIASTSVISEPIQILDTQIHSGNGHPTPDNSMSLAFLRNEEERLIIEIAKSPKDASLYEKLGDIYMEMANFNDAKESYEAAVELNSQSDSFKQKLSFALEKLSSQN